MTHNKIGDVGHAALWIGFFGMFLPTLYFAMVVANAKSKGRSFFFETLTMSITAIASIAYLMMATNQGYVGGEDDGDRQFFYVRYIDWTLTTPLMLLDIAGIAGASFDTQFLLVLTDIMMIVAGLVGAHMNEGSDHESYKWAFFAMGMFFYMPIVYFLLQEIPGGRGKSAAALAKTVGLFTLVLWSAYPIVWFIAEGTETISPDTEAIMYTILDVLAKSVFGFMIVSAREALDEASARASTAVGARDASLLPAPESGGEFGDDGR